MKARTGILILAIALFVASLLALNHGEVLYGKMAQDDAVNERHGQILLEYTPDQILGYVILTKELYPEKYDDVYFWYKASIYSCGASIVFLLIWILTLSRFNFILFAVWMIFSYTFCGAILNMAYTGAFRTSADTELFKGIIDYPLFELSGISYHLKSNSVNSAVGFIDKELETANEQIELLYECFPGLSKSEFIEVYKKVIMDKRNNKLTQEYMSCLAAGIKPKWTPDN